jgi:tetratricopeptide (TPR) repeat protein
VLPLLFVPWIALAPPGTSATTVEDSSTRPEADLSEAARLFDAGQTRYEAADYEGAIEIFTQALAALRDQGVDDFRIRGLLLFNIGRAHVRAYDIDRDLEHLRQAQAILRRFVEQGRASDAVAPEDIAEAEHELDNIAAMLAEADEDETATPGPVLASADPPAADGSEPTGPTNAAITRTRRTGIGLSVAGVALIGGGVGVLVWGAGFGPAAQAALDNLDDLGLPEDDPAFDRGEDFVVDERRKGNAWMAAGGVGAALGVAGLAVGIQQLVKAKSMKSQLTATGGWDRHGVYLGVAGRF